MSLKELDATEDLSGACLLKREKEGSVFGRSQTCEQSIWCPEKKTAWQCFNSKCPADYMVSLSRTPYKKNGMHVNTQLFPEGGRQRAFLPGKGTGT